jgi:hypothetical protein
MTLWSRNAFALLNRGHVKRSHIFTAAAWERFLAAVIFNPELAAAARKRTRVFRATADFWISS